MTTRSSRFGARVLHAVGIFFFVAAACGGGGETKPDVGVLPDSGNDEPWITIAPNGRYFGLSDGSRAFFPRGFALHGEHLSLDYYGTVTVNGVSLTFPEDHLERYFASLADAGDNFVRIDIEGIGFWDTATNEALIAAGKLQFLETAPGALNPAFVERVDRLFALAEKYDAYVQLVMTPHTCDFEHNLPLYPWHTANGGPIRDSLNDLLVDAQARELWKQRIELLVRHWGGRSRLFSWELWNELLNCGGTDPEAAEAWVAEMGQFVKELELERYGRSHLVAVSTMDLVPQWDFFLQSSATDFNVTHLYIREQNPVRVAKAIRAAIPENLAATGYSRPHMDNERTLGIFYPAQVIFDSEHAAAWAFVGAGAASPGAPWVRSGPYPPFRQKDIMRTTHRAIGEALDGLDLQTGDFRLRPELAATDNPELLLFPLLDAAHGGILWLLHDNETDYEIDLIHGWFAEEITSPFAEVLPLKYFAGIYQAAGVAIDTAPIRDRLVTFLMTELGMSEAAAQAEVDAFFLDPVAGIERLRATIAASANPSAALSALAAVMDELRSYLAGVEATEKVLATTYRGHPTQTGTVMTSGLSADVSYAAQWLDDETGAPLGTETVFTGDATLPIPAFSKHVVLRLVPR